MSMRWILTMMIAGTLLMAGLFYGFLKNAPQYKAEVTEKMLVDFQAYAHQTKNMDLLMVATSGPEAYFVNTQSPAWKFEIHDKVLYVVAPAPEEHANHQAMPANLFPEARKKTEDFIWSWVDDKFHERKDLKLEVHFLNEPQAQ